ncbi:MAG: hypothetical protein OEV43_07605, partial [Coriobacteriia bacterium]|nr:hypothetical protein [Coriobacteriia bacterium]
MLVFRYPDDSFLAPEQALAGWLVYTGGFVKYVVLILDGASGWPLPELGGRTTLQVAEIPNLDRMARQGIVGLAQTVPEGIEPSSSAACTSILGYDPVADLVGRG